MDTKTEVTVVWTASISKISHNSIIPKIGFMRFLFVLRKDKVYKQIMKITFLITEQIRVFNDSHLSMTSKVKNPRLSNILYKINCSFDCFSSNIFLTLWLNSFDRTIAGRLRQHIVIYPFIERSIYFFQKHFHLVKLKNCRNCWQEHTNHLKNILLSAILNKLCNHRTMNFWSDSP